MSRYINPKNFHELVVEIAAMNFGDWAENEDSGCYVEIGNLREVNMNFMKEGYLLVALTM